MCNQEDKKSPVPVEVKERLIELIADDQEVKELLSVSFKELIISTYNSHLPKSAELEKLELLSPGITDKLIEMMQKHQNSEIDFDRESLKLEDKRLNTIKHDIDENHTTVRTGQKIGAGVVAVVLFLTWMLIQGGHPGLGVTLFLGTGVIGTAVSAFTGFFSRDIDKEANNNNEED